MREESKLKLKYILQLADNNMICGQRNSEWCGHGPVLEQDIALTNITLDLIGESRSLYQYAAKLQENGQDEDDIAFVRKEHEYLNCQICEHPNTDWAYTVVRQFLYDAFHYYLEEWLCNSNDPEIAAIASKSVKEAAYHLKWSSEWMIRLGDGTAESHERMQNALNDLWTYSGEFFIPSEADLHAESSGYGPSLSAIRQKWEAKVQSILKEATLNAPENAYMQEGGKRGIHTEHMGYLLAEMQYMQRAYPGMEW